jgi:hypothetical protein
MKAPLRPRWVAGIAVASLSALIATLPELTVNWADPRLPNTADNPEMLRKAASKLLPAPKGTEAVPITTPELFQTVIETVTGTVLGFAMATPVL